MLTEIFKAFLITSLAGSCLAAILTLIKPVTRKLFGYSWHYYIWLAVLITMLLPVRFTLPTRAVTETAPVQQAAQTEQVSDTAAPVESTVQTEEAVPKASVLEQSAELMKTAFDNRLNVLVVLWLVGVLALLAVNIIGYLRLIIKMRKKSIVISCPEIKSYTRRKITARVWENTSSPFMVGVFKPTLVLPSRELTEEQLNNILRHEMTHLRRYDILYKQFAQLVKCLHWFNPVIWYVVKQINIECEISCDMAVTKDMSRDEEMSYVNTILSLLPSGKPLPLTTQMASSKKILKRRFTMIRNKKKTSKLVSVLSAVVAVVMLGTTVFASGTANGILSENISEWAKNDIKKAEEYAIINDSMNITDYTENITRSLFCDIAANVLVHNGVTLTAWEYPFTDVNEYGGSIHSLYCMGIVNGKTETEFRPNDYITREEAAAILYRMYKYTGLTEYYSETEKYIFEDDENISDWAKDAVYALQLTHIINGIGNNTFDPKSHFTTEQAISSMVRLYDILNEAHLTVTNINRARQDIRVFYSCFNQREFDAMKNYCTQDCINGFFGDGYVFGMTQAALVDINFETNESLQKENKVAAFVTVNMTPHENSVFDQNQTSTSFYVILQRQPNDRYLIDEFATGL